MKTGAAALALLAAATATPAVASGGIACTGDGVAVDLSVGRLAVISVLRATVRIGDTVWSTDPEIVPGTPIAVGQAFEDESRLLVDFTDEAVNAIVGRLRVFFLTEGDGYAAGGVVSFKDEGAFVVDCSERG
ncbi:hypothetical protein [Nitratireductor sp. StC3]|uniref:hypothetical protein n=1 Tax=Nitratireductor sp. StC3 TaxID=2126741 RepID=UPI000D0E2854|nr:hypothetical protein [Nitratireductor sp. StC3]PSM19957.1 hypothetical protein C7T96_02505 [Nitratireductor sp. StC3]